MNTTRGVPSEIDQVMTLIKEAISEMERNGIHQWDEIYPDRTVMLNDVAAGQLYSTMSGNTITGVITLNEDQPSEYGSISWNDEGRPLVVHRLCIDPEFQGQGLAKRLMEFAEDYARENNFTSIRLDAFPDNSRAVALYDSLNYQLLGTVRFRKGEFYCYEKVLQRL
jgi:ribosomal protein S18 acetylase RimI-like enzyme